MYLFKFITFYLVVIAICSLSIINDSYARPTSKEGEHPRPEPVFCTKGYWGPVNCNNNIYNSCFNSSNNQIVEALNKLLTLQQESASAPAITNNCMKELVSLIKNESDLRSSLDQTKARVNNLKDNIKQLVHIQKLQENYFKVINFETRKLQSALPEIAIHLNELFTNQNIKIDLIIAQLFSEMELSKDQDENEKIELEIEIFKNLRITQSKLSPSDPKAFADLVYDSLYGEGEKKLKAISAFDPLTYLVLKTILDNKLISLGKFNENEIVNQMFIISNEMKNFISKKNSDLDLELIKFETSHLNFESATKNRSIKESICADFDERINVLPNLINNASIDIEAKKSLLVNCKKHCTNNWIPGECYGR